MVRNQSNQYGVTVAVMLGVMALFVVATLLPKASYASVDSQAPQYGVVLPVGSDAAQAFAVATAAGGTLVRHGFTDWIIITSSDDPTYSEKLYQAGALLVFNPAVLGGCAFQSRYGLRAI